MFLQRHFVKEEVSEIDDIEQNLAFAGGIDGGEGKVLAPEVHVGHQHADFGVGTEFKAGGNFEVGVAGRDHELVGGGSDSHHAFLNGTLRENHADRGLISAGLTVGCVVQLQDDIGAGFDQLAPTFRQGVYRCTGGVADEVFTRPVFTLAGAVGNSRLCTLHPVRPGWPDVGDYVVYQFQIAWTNLSGLNPLIFCEIQWDQKVLVVDGPFFRNVILLRHGDDKVWLTDIPAIDELDRHGQVLRIALGRAVVDPCEKSVNFALRHAAVIGEFTKVRVGKPWRHATSLNSFLDRRSPGPSRLVVQQREGCCLTWPVAALAVLLQNGGYIFAESW